jgi:ABC-type transport system substrate-binding protein
VQADAPQLLIFETDLGTTSTVLTFGHNPGGENQFADERVRRAVSMSWDRDLFIAAKYDTDSMETEGIPLKTAWNSHLAARPPFMTGGWWLDPQGKDFGPNARYFQFDLAEAKKLLTAAGQENLEATVHYPQTPQYNLKQDSEPIIGFLQGIMKVNVNAEQDYTQGYIPLNRDASGAFEGMGIHSVSGTTPSVVSPTSAMVAEHWPGSGVTFHGYSADGGDGKTGDPPLAEMLNKARLELNTERRKQLIHEAQRYLGKAMWSLIFPGGATGIVQVWPAVENYRVWQGKQWYRIWLNTSKAPFV